LTTITRLVHRHFFTSSKLSMPIAVISPAKSLDESPLPAKMTTTPNPAFDKQRDMLIDVASKLSKDALKK
jgi:cytoplasmic iron level regulating protein YaaA (DUF328/UPF0246 family)